MKALAYNILSCTLLLLLASCAQKDCATEKYCTYGASTLTPGIKGYKLPEIDTVVVIFYEPGGSFSVKRDEWVVDSSYLMNPNNILPYSDTTNAPYFPQEAGTVNEWYKLDALRMIRFANEEESRIYDIQIIIPGADYRSYRIRDIVMDGQKTVLQQHPCDRQPSGCTRRITSYVLDNVKIYSDQLTLIR
jgi:hypothetical protein